MSWWLLRWNTWTALVPLRSGYRLGTGELARRVVDSHELRFENHCNRLQKCGRQRSFIPALNVAYTNAIYIANHEINLNHLYLRNWFNGVALLKGDAVSEKRYSELRATRQLSLTNTFTGSSAQHVLNRLAQSGNPKTSKILWFCLPQSSDQS